MRVLVDTSVWSLALRRGENARNPEAEELRHLIAAHVVDIIGPIRQEVLSGVRDAAHFARLESHLEAFPDLPLETEEHVTAATFYNQCRARGIQGSNTDFLICAVAARRGLAIFTTDRDFTLFAKTMPIALHSPGGRSRSAASRHRRTRSKRGG